MTEQDIENLARLIAEELKRARTASAAREQATEGHWVPAPVRPDPPVRTHDPPPWSGAALTLGDVAPVRTPVSPAHRADPGVSTALIRAAAAGAYAPPQSGYRGPNTPARGQTTKGGRVRTPARDKAVSTAVFPVGISNRHVHLSPEHARLLFGTSTLTVDRSITQPGQFAATERVSVLGPAGQIERVRVVGPPRGETQLELSASDAQIVGISPPVRSSGSLEGSSGGVRLVGPAGTVELERGVIIPGRHLHLSVADGDRLSLPDGAVVSVRCGSAPRDATLHGVLVRCGPAHATELHLDTDEALALGVASGTTATLIARETSQPVGRRLFTERDIVALGSRGEVPADALLTPSARDRARSMGLRLP